MGNGNGQKKCEGCGADISSGKLCDECQKAKDRLLGDL
jgi:hypothetical protein